MTDDIREAVARALLDFDGGQFGEDPQVDRAHLEMADAALAALTASAGDVAGLVERGRGFGRLIRESEGIAGFHLKGAVEPWGEDETTPDDLADALTAQAAENARLREAARKLDRLLVRFDKQAESEEYPDAVTWGDVRKAVRDLTTGGRDDLS